MEKVFFLRLDGRVDTSGEADGRFADEARQADGADLALQRSRDLLHFGNHQSLEDHGEQARLDAVDDADQLRRLTTRPTRSRVNCKSQFLDELTTFIQIKKSDQYQENPRRRKK